MAIGAVIDQPEVFGVVAHVILAGTERAERMQEKPVRGSLLELREEQQRQHPELAQSDRLLNNHAIAR